MSFQSTGYCIEQKKKSFQNNGSLCAQLGLNFMKFYFSALTILV